MKIEEYKKTHIKQKYKMIKKETKQFFKIYKLFEKHMVNVNIISQAMWTDAYDKFLLAMESQQNYCQRAYNEIERWEHEK